MNSGYLGDNMKIVGVRSGYLEVDAPNASTTQVISKDDFEKVWEIWSDYKTGKFPRYQIRDMTRFSKYIISILHSVELDGVALSLKIEQAYSALSRYK